MDNFTVADLVYTTLAILAFALFLVPPGYLLGIASDAFGMRNRSAAEKLLFSTAFSFAVTPILATLITRFTSYKVTLALFLFLALISVVILVRGSQVLTRQPRGVRRSTWVLLGMALVWFLVVQFSLVDLQVGHRLYVTYVAFDYSVRVPFVEAAARTVPPLNPFYKLISAPVLRYYYYWYVVCALPRVLFGLSAKACLIGSVFWSGLGLASIIPLFLKYGLDVTAHLRRKSIIGVALLTVTGLDLIPYLAISISFHFWQGDMEWWDPNQVSSWIASLLWAPHHVASLTACMAGLLAIAVINEESLLRQRVWATAISGLAFASAAGLSLYVAFTFAVFAFLWLLFVLAEKKIRTSATYAAAGAFSVLLTWPFLHDLQGTAGASEPAPRFASFALRDFPAGLAHLVKLGISNPLVLELAKIPILLIVYVLEFGFFALIAVVCARLEWANFGKLSSRRRMLWFMFIVCLLTMSVLRSNATGSNDLGFRGMLVVQFVLLLWAAPLLDDFLFPSEGTPRRSPWWRGLLVVTLLMGIAGSAFEVVALRGYAPLAESGKFVRRESMLGEPGFGERTYWIRQGFEQLNKRTAGSSLVQYNPIREEVLMDHLYSARQAAIGDVGCGSDFGGDPQQCKGVLPAFVAVFNQPETIQSWDLDRFCDAFGLNVLVSTDTDPVWRDSESWVWSRPTLIANPAMRAFACGTASPAENRQPR